MAHPVDFVMKMEGGFVNDPADPGGATIHGISLRFLKVLGPDFGDFDGDGDVDVEDILSMTQDQARFLYMTRFYGRLNIWRYSHSVGSVLLDTAVNMGRYKAVVIMQRALNKLGCSLAEDGVPGPLTSIAEDSVDDELLVRTMILERIFEYVRLCDRNPKLKRFFFGWISRCRELDRFAMESGS